MKHLPFSYRTRRISRLTEAFVFRRHDFYEPGQNADAKWFYPSRYAMQRWFKGEGRRRRDPVTRGLRVGGQISF